MSITLSALQQQRRDTAANWTSANPTLLAGEIGVETDTGLLKIGDGSTAWTSLDYLPLSFEGYAANGIYNPAANQVALATNGTGRLFIDSSGNAGVGTATPDSGLHIVKNTNPVLKIDRGADNTANFNLYYNGTLRGQIGGASNSFQLSAAGSTAPMEFYTNGSEAMRIDSSGRLLVGSSTSPSAGGGQYTKLAAVGNTASDAGDGRIMLGRGLAATGMSNDSDIGGIYFTDNTGATFAEINAQVDGTPGSGDYPGRLVFRTTADSSSGPTERMRIDSSGNVGIGTSTTTSLGSGFKEVIVSGSTEGAGLQLQDTDGNVKAGLFTSDVSNFAVMRTITNHPLVFRTNNTERMRIDSSGNVGIGDSSPGQKLVVKDTTSASTSAYVNVISGNTGNAGIIFGDSDADSVGGVLYNNNDEALRFFKSGFSEAARIDSSGNVGIGTSSPSSILHIGGAVTPTTLTIQSNTESSVLFQDSGGSPISFKAGTNISSNHGGFEIYNETSSSSALVVGSSNNVGIGTTDINFPSGSGVEVYDASTPRLKLSNSTTGTASTDGSYLYVSGSDFLIENKENANMRFYTNATEAARIDSSGRLLVGTSSAVTGGTSQYSRILALGNSAGASNPGVIAVGMGATPASGNNIGRIFFVDNAAGEYAEISAQCDGTPGTGDYPGRLVFSTTADGDSSPTVALTINRNQELFTIPTYTATTANAANVVVFSNGNLARSTSSAKYKTNIETIELSYSDALLDCRPVWYRSTTTKDNATWSWWGFIAEEVAEIDPRLVHWKTTEVTYDDNGSAVETPCDPEPEGVAYDRFVPHLLNLIKRQKEQIEAMEARLSALESA